MQGGTLLQRAGERAGQRHLEAIQNPGDAEREHDAGVKAAPRQRVKPCGNAGFDDAIGRGRRGDHRSIVRRWASLQFHRVVASDQWTWPRFTWRGRGRSDQGGAAFRLPPATTSAAKAGSRGNDRSRRRFSMEPQGVDAWLTSERRHILAKQRRAHRSAGLEADARTKESDALLTPRVRPARRSEARDPASQNRRRAGLAKTCELPPRRHAATTIRWEYAIQDRARA